MLLKSKIEFCFPLNTFLKDFGWKPFKFIVLFKITNLRYFAKKKNLMFDTLHSLFLLDFDE